MKKKLLLCAVTGLLVGNAFGGSQPFEGKKANFLGDSITKGTSRKNSYVNAVKEALGLSVARNYGVSGGAICYRGNIPRFKTRKFHGKLIDDQYPPVVSRWQDMDDDADLIFMLIGTNDYNSRVKLGDVDSTDKYQFNGCLNIVLKGLREKYPDKVIIVSTILKRKAGGRRLLKYNDAIKEACKKYGITCYDGYTQTGLDFETEYKEKNMVNTRDGLHPNEAGAKVLGQKIAEFITAQVSK